MELSSMTYKLWKRFKIYLKVIKFYRDKLPQSTSTSFKISDEL
jgi:hypothetical protein